jgi:hypothetical protein
LWFVLLLVGAVSLAFGIIGVLSNDEGQTGAIAMLMGMFTGIGGVLAIVSMIRLIYMAVVSPKKLKQQEIDLKDERNVQITKASLAASSVAATLLFAVMSFVFVWLGYVTPALFMVGAMWVQAIVTMIAHAVNSRKM